MPQDGGWKTSCWFLLAAVAAICLALWAVRQFGEATVVWILSLATLLLSSLDLMRFGKSPD